MKQFFKDLLSDHKGRTSSSKVISVFVTILIAIIMIWLMCCVPSFTSCKTDKEFIALANSSSLTQILNTIVQLAGVLAALAGVNYAVTKTTDTSAMNTEARCRKDDPNRLKPMGQATEE